MRILAGTALALLIGFGAARAEEAVTPERLVLAKEVMALSGAMKLYDNYEKNLDVMVGQIRQSVPAIDDATASDLKKIAVEEFNASKPEMIEGAAKIYASHFSESDLKALIAFYKTPAGQHFTAALPTVMEESMKLTAPFTARYLARVQAYIADKIAAHNAEAATASPKPSKDKKDK